MNEFPKITVITANYNQGAFLETTIQSVLDQKYPNIEYIVIDGGSTDNSVDIIRKYEQSLTYWVSERDKGQTDAINKGLKKASGEIITWLNGDDFFLPGALEYMIQQYQQSPFDFILGNCQFVDINGSLLADQKKSSLINGNYFIPGDPRCVVNQPSSFFSKKIIDHTGLLDESLHYAMDVDFWMKIMAYGGKMAYADHDMTCFRRHGEAKSAGGNLPFIRETLGSDFFRNRLKKLNRTYYYQCKKSIYRSYMYNLVLEHHSKELLGFFPKAFFSYPGMAFKTTAGYLLKKVNLFFRSRFVKKPVG